MERTKSKSLLRLCVFFSFLLLVAEATLRIASSISERAELVLINRVSELRLLDDPVLGHRGNPKFIDHDENGFRNASIPVKADIVVLGDSQCYGINAPRDWAWPQQLSRMLGQAVYNMGLGSYSPPHYLYLLDEALSHEPDLVITAIYSGNDLRDSVFAVHRRQAFAEYFPEIEMNADMYRKVEDSHRQAMDHTREMARILDPGFSISEKPEKGKYASFNSLKRSMEEYVRNKLRVYGLARAVKTYMKGQLFSRKNPLEKIGRYSKSHWYELVEYAQKTPGVFAVEAGTIRTVLAPRDRVWNEDLTKRGLEIIVHSIDEIHSRSSSEGIEHMAVLIPTKEYVFRNIARQTIIDDGSYERLVSYEKELWRKITGFLQEKHIAFVDTAYALEAAAHEGNQIYPYSSQSHPNALGYKVIAETVAKILHGRLFSFDEPIQNQ